MTDAKTCTVCGIATSSKCSRCKGARYCSITCQGQDWRTHKLVCKLPHDWRGGASGGGAQELKSKKSTGQTDDNGDGDGGGGDVGGGGDGGGGFDGGYNDWRGGANGGAQELESKKRTGQTDDNGDGDGGWGDVGGGGGGGGFDGGYANFGLLGSNVEDLVPPDCLDAMSYTLDASSDTRLMFDSDKWRLHLSREGVVLALVDLEKALRRDLGFEVWACYIVDDEMDQENNVFRCRYYYSCCTQQQRQEIDRGREREREREREMIITILFITKKIKPTPTTPH
jgi:hypothetical protein